MYSNTLIKTIFWGEGEGKREVEGGERVTDNGEVVIADLYSCIMEAVKM